MSNKVLEEQTKQIKDVQKELPATENLNKEVAVSGIDTKNQSSEPDNALLHSNLNSGILY